MSMYFTMVVACLFSVQETEDIHTYSLRRTKGIGASLVLNALGSNPYKVFCGDNKS